MTLWNIQHGDLLDSCADGLICSANPSLNLSGGVGGAFALRFGDAMQTFLHSHLKERGRRYVDPGDVVIAPSCGSPFSAVAHAVAIDSFYDTDSETILRTYDAAIGQLAASECATIAAACLGCGYGRVSSDVFADIAAELAQHHYDGIDTITLITTNANLAEVVRRVFSA